DPLAARFDQVLRAVDDGDGAVRVDRGDVAGLEPAFAVDRVARPFEISGGDPRRLGAEVADGHAVVRQRLVRVVHDAALRADSRAAPAVHALGQRRLQREAEGAWAEARRGEAEGFRHAPELTELDPLRRELPDQALRGGSAGRIDRAEVRELATLALHP